MVYFVRGPLRFKLGQMKPLAIDLFCGLGGWAEGFIAEGYKHLARDRQRQLNYFPQAHAGGNPKLRDWSLNPEKPVSHPYH